MPALKTVRGVPIARAGIWETSTGRWTCTREQLADAVRASQDPSFRRGVLKLGHVDPRFDGTPAVGRLDNLRVDASGDVLLADLVGVPAWLADVLASAYPSRSVEASLGVVTADGNAYAMVVTGLALLGETAPAIESLGDIAALYDQPTGVDDWVAASRVAASISKDGTVTPARHAPGAALVGEAGPELVRVGRGDRVAASAQIDALVEEATKYAANNGITYPWVRDVYTDKVIVVGGDADDSPGETDDLFEIDWTETGGVFTFTGPWEVQVTYTRVDDHDGSPGDTGTPAAASAPRSSTVPVRYVRGRGDVSASIPEEQDPVSDLAAQVRERLGLDPTATDEQVTAALDSRLGTAGQQGTPTPDQTPQGGQGDPAPAPAAAPAPEAVAASAADQRASIDRLIAERVEAATAPLRQSLAETSAELAARRERERVERRDLLLAAAVKAGKITPASLDDRDGTPGWRSRYDRSQESAEAVELVMASLADGTAVPTAPIPGAHTGGDAPTGAGFTDADYDRLFPSTGAGAL